MNIGVLGSGQVAKTLGAACLQLGHSVMLGSREASKVAGWSTESGAQAGTFAEAAAFGEIVIIAVKGTAASQVVELAGDLSGKVVIDANNPIADAPPVNGVLQYFTGPNDSLMERLQNQAPNAHFVKAFSCVGSHFMFRPSFPGGTPTMFICGNNAEAKAKVTALLTDFGWETADMGQVEAARAIEPLCQLWCLPGLSRGQWTHAFKLLK